MLGIFLLSVSLLALEIGVTRINSAIFSYHYAFLVISFSVLGLGLGGLILHWMGKKEGSLMIWLQRIYGLAYLGTLLTMYFLPYLGSPIFYILIGMIPFLIGGTILTHYFKDPNLRIHQLYFADLLGSVFGAILVLIAFQQIGTFSSLLLITIIAFLSMVWLSKTKQERMMHILCTLPLVILLFLPGLQDWGNDAFLSFYTSPYAERVEGRRPYTPIGMALPVRMSSRAMRMKSLFIWMALQVH
jgi:uncharacterized membrane protein YeaQ/YmgE (transglycosylase-associated protein family)